MRAADGLNPGLRQAKMLHFAFGNQIRNGPRHLFNGHIGIDTVLVVEIDNLGFQSF
ncbi:hypothetical protein D3C76_1865710 [compost metagenome]